MASNSVFILFNDHIFRSISELIRFDIFYNILQTLTLFKGIEINMSHVSSRFYINGGSQNTNIQ